MSISNKIKVVHYCTHGYGRNAWCEECEMDKQNDIINHPKHYMMLPNMEAIEGIKKLLTNHEFIGYLKGNFFKYRFRAGDKDALQQDIDKSNWYRDYLKDYLNKDNYK